MTAPDLNIDDVKEILKDVEIIDIGDPIRGGQKLVLPITTKQNGTFFVKFIQVHPLQIEREETGEIIIEDGTLGRLKREIDILKKCNCENLVRLFSDGLIYIFYKEKHLFYYTEEAIYGNDLSVLIGQKYEFSINEVIQMALDINNAIKALWGEKLIHRDIKPNNIIYDEKNSKFVLIDPGIAFNLQEQSFTQPGYKVGTFEFMSPEQLKTSDRRSLDFRSDHFLLGICLYMVSTGEHPFAFDLSCNADIHKNIIHNKHISLKQKSPLIPERLSNLVDRLLAKEPHMRYRTPDLLNTELVNIKEILN